MHNLKSFAQVLTVRGLLTLLVLGFALQGWAQSGSPAPVQAESQTQETAQVESSSPASEPKNDTQSTPAEAADDSRAADNAGVVDKEFNPTEEIVEDQAVSFPVDI